MGNINVMHRLISLIRNRHFLFVCLFTLVMPLYTFAQSKTKVYSNQYFSIRYPLDWKVVKENCDMSANTTISVQIMDINYTQTKHANINVIVSNKQYEESTKELSTYVIKSFRHAGINVKLLKYGKPTKISGLVGHYTEYLLTDNGLVGSQYVVKDKANTTYIITCTIDKNDQKNFQKTKNIINSIIIKNKNYENYK